MKTGIALFRVVSRRLQSLCCKSFTLISKISHILCRVDITSYLIVGEGIGIDHVQHQHTQGWDRAREGLQHLVLGEVLV